MAIRRTRISSSSREFFVRAGGYTRFWEYRPGPQPEPPAPPGDYSAAFERFWAAYPKHIAKKSAWKAWNVQLRKGRTAEQLITAATNYATAMADKDPAYMMHPSTFLGPSDRWWDCTQPVAAQKRLTRAASSLLQWAEREEVKRRDQDRGNGSPGDDSR